MIQKLKKKKQKKNKKKFNAEFEANELIEIDETLSQSKEPKKKKELEKKTLYQQISEIGIENEFDKIMKIYQNVE